MPAQAWAGPLVSTQLAFHVFKPFKEKVDIAREEEANRQRTVDVVRALGDVTGEFDAISKKICLQALKDENPRVRLRDQGT